MLRLNSVATPLAALLGTAVQAGCPSRDVSKVDPRQATEQNKEIPINLSRDLDLLFVIDNSISMKQEQDSLSANFPDFIDILEGIEGGLPSLHLGVVSSDMGMCPAFDRSMMLRRFEPRATLSRAFTPRSSGPR